jgi:hypothetical protein
MFDDPNRPAYQWRMKTLLSLPVTLALAVTSLAQDAKPKTTTDSGSTNKAPAINLAVSAATVSAPFVLTNGMISQPERTDLPDGGKAVFTVSIPKAGNYLIKGMVNAADEESNSFYVNFDKEPEDPMMIWDIEVTSGFEERTVNWRGNGDSASGEFLSKKFNLTAGDHKLIIMGREPAQLKSISIAPAN